MRAYLIARVSTLDQEDALPGQIYKLEDYARRNELVGTLYQIRESAFKDGRKDFRVVVDQIVAETEKVIVVFDKIDRYSRDVGAAETRVLRKLCEKDKIEIHFPSDHLFVNHNSPAQVWFMLNMGEANSEYYSRSVSDNVRRRFDQKLRDGEWIGMAPIGYRNVNLENGKKWVEIDPRTAPMIRSMFGWYATGQESYITVRKRLETEYGYICTLSKVEWILRNPFYSGQMRVKGKLYPHQYERLIDPSLFERVNSNRAAHTSHSRRYGGLPYAFRGLVTCAECGCKVTFEIKKSKYIYGHCTQWRYKHQASYVPESVFHKEVLTALSSFRIPDDVLADLSEKLSAEFDKDKTNAEKQLASIELNIQNYNNRIERALEAYLDGDISKDKYNEKVAEFKQARAKLEERRQNFELIEEQQKFSVLHLLTLANKATKLFEKADFKQKRELINLTLSNLELDGDQLRWKLKKPFEMMAFCSVNANWLRRLDSNQ